MNKVIKPFFDKTDNNKPYTVGDTYKHKDAKRIAFLIEQGFIDGEAPKEKPKKKSPKKSEK
jgi:hypothetical protein